MFPLRPLALASCMLLALGGCEKAIGFPDIKPQIAQNDARAKWLGFLPLNQILQGAGDDTKDSTQNGTALAERAKALRARAKALRAPISQAQENLKQL